MGVAAPETSFASRLSPIGGGAGVPLASGSLCQHSSYYARPRQIEAKVI